MTSLVVDASRPAPAEFADGWDVIMEAEGDEEATSLEYVLEGAAHALEGLAETDDWLLWLERPPCCRPGTCPQEFLERYLVELAEEAGTDEESDEDAGALEPLLDPPAGPLDPGDDLTFIRLQRTYAAAVSYLDAGLELLLKLLEERDVLDELLLIVTTDHGLAPGRARRCRPEPARAAR